MTANTADTGTAGLMPKCCEVRSAVTTRWYATLDGPPEPVALFGQLARAGIRLRCSGDALVAEVPELATREPSWPRLERRLERHAASLVSTVRLIQRFAERHSAPPVAALLAELDREVPEILLETVGGDERLSTLISAEPRGLDFDLACLACCRSLAIRAIHRGQGLAGLLDDGRVMTRNEDDDTEPLRLPETRRYQTHRNRSARRVQTARCRL